MADTKSKGFRTVSNSSKDKMEYQRQIQEHRMNVLKRIVIATATVLLLVGGTALYVSLRLYTDYDLRASAKRADTKATQFKEFQNNILNHTVCPKRSYSITSVIFTFTNVPVQSFCGAEKYTFPSISGASYILLPK